MIIKEVNLDLFTEEEYQFFIRFLINYYTGKFGKILILKEV